MRRAIILIRISYWMGAVLDGIMAIPMLFPRIGGAVFGIDDFTPGNEYRYAMMIGASLMLGWTVLLLWADRKPLERKGVLLITVFPVIVGMVLAGIFAVQVGIIAAERMVLTWGLQIFLLIFFSYSYYSALIAGRVLKSASRRR